jgi:hypothetical protein
VAYGGGEGACHGLLLSSVHEDTSWHLSVWFRGASCLPKSPRPARHCADNLKLALSMPVPNQIILLCLSGRGHPRDVSFVPILLQKCVAAIREA